MRILIVEDEPAHADAIRRAFEAAGVGGRGSGGEHAAGVPRTAWPHGRRTSP